MRKKQSEGQNVRNKVLAMAINNQKQGILELLRVHKDIDLGSIEDDTGNSLVHLAAATKDINYLNCLLNYQRQFLLTQNSEAMFAKNVPLALRAWLMKTNSQGLSAIHLAAQKGSLPILMLMKEMECDCQLKAPGAMSLLHLASQSSQINAVCYLVQELSFSPQETDGKGRTAAHLAAEGDADQVLSYFYSNGFNFSVKDSSGNTCLDDAVLSRSEKAVCLLLRIGVDRELSAQAKQVAQQDENIREMLERKCSPTVLAFSSYFSGQSKLRCLKVLAMPVTFFLPVAFFAVSTKLSGNLYQYQEQAFLGVMALIFLSWLYFVLRPLQSARQAKLSMLLEQDKGRGDKICYSCRAFRQIGAEHCYFCGCCVEEPDHHSGLAGKCISKGQTPAFFFMHFLWLLSLAVFIYAIYDGITLSDSRRQWFPQNLNWLRLGLLGLSGLFSACNCIYCATKLVLLFDNALLGITANSRLLSQYNSGQKLSEEKRLYSETDSLLLQQHRRRSCGNLRRAFCTC